MVSLSGLPGSVLPDSVIDTIRDLGWQDSLAIVSDTTADLAPWKSEPALEAAMAGADEYGRALLALFLLNQPVQRGVLEAALSPTAVTALLDSRVVRELDQDKLISDFLLVRVDGLALFASWRAADREGGSWDPWIGPDSVMLSRLIRARRPRSTVDLGCGTGVLGLHAAAVGSDVTAIDLEPTCVRATRFNAALNRLDTRVDARVADLTEFSAKRDVDLVLSNPPFFPVPVGALNFTAAEAGWDGLDFVRDIMRSLPETLSEHGESLLLAAGYGDEKGPFLAAELATMFAEHSLAGRLSLMKPIPARWPVMAVHRHRDVTDSAELSRQVGEYVRRIGATHYHPFVLSCWRSKTPRLSMIQPVRNSGSPVTFR